MNVERRAELILVLTTLLAASGWIFTKESIQEMPPFGFLGLRFLLASICLLPFCYREFSWVKRSDIVKAMGIGSILCSGILLWLFAVAVSETLGEGAFIMSLAMLFAPLLAWPLLGLKPSAIFWISLPIAFSGLALLAMGGDDGWQMSSSQFLFLGAAVMMALHFNLNSKYARRIPVLLLTCLQLLSIGLISSVASLLFEQWPDSISSQTWGWFMASVLLATSIRYVLMTTGQKHSLPANAAIIMTLEPVWTVILSVLWYGEEMPAYKVAGCLLIFLALLTFRSGGHLAGRLAKLK